MVYGSNPKYVAPLIDTLEDMVGKAYTKKAFELKIEEMKLKGLDKFVMSLMQIMSDYTCMEEGFMLTPPKDNARTRKLASMIDNELQII